MAGGERVEGTLFGNGERTGNVDLVTLALNLLTQGVDPKLDFSQLDEAQAHRRGVQRAAGPSAPSVGRRARLHGVLRLAPGRDQEGHARAASGRTADVWDVPYLPIDPKDVGRTYEAIIRVNSQSGKGGVAYLLAGRVRPRPSARAPGRLRAEGAGDHRRRGRRADRRTSSGAVPGELPASATRTSSSRTRTEASERRRPAHRAAARSTASRARSSRARATARSRRSSTRSPSDSASTSPCSTTTSTR